MSERLLRVSEVSRMLGVHPSTVRSWADRGVLPAQRVGPRQERRFRESEVMLMLEHDPEAEYKRLAWLCRDFADALFDKLVAAEDKYGFEGSWRSPDWHGQLVVALQSHLSKGDPRDVAAYCAFAWYHGWEIDPGSRARRGE